MKLNELVKIHLDIIKLYSLDIHGFDYVPIGFGECISGKEVVVYEVE